MRLCLPNIRHNSVSEINYFEVINTGQHWMGIISSISILSTKFKYFNKYYNDQKHLTEASSRSLWQINIYDFQSCISRSYGFFVRLYDRWDEMQIYLSKHSERPCALFLSSKCHFLWNHNLFYRHTIILHWQSHATSTRTRTKTTWLDKLDQTSWHSWRNKLCSISSEIDEIFFFTLRLLS